MEKKLKNLKVEKKLRYAFTSILILLVGTIVVAILSNFVISRELNSFYNECYQDSVTQMEIRKDLQSVGKLVLWSMTTEDPVESNNYLQAAEECGNNIAVNVEKLKKTFPEKELLDKLDVAIAEIKTLRQELTSLASANRNEEALELFNGDYNTATENTQNILTTIGEYTDEAADLNYKQANLAGIIAFVVVILIGVFSVAFAIRIGNIIGRLIRMPIQEIEAATYKLKNGDLNVEITYQSEDELGSLAVNFKEACDTLHEIVQDVGYLLGEMAGGNFNISIEKEEKYVGEFVQLIQAMQKLNQQLDSTLHRINEASEQVALGSSQLAEGAQSLAEGATDQAGAVEELTATIESVSALAVQSAQTAAEEAKKILAAKQDAEKGRGDLKELRTAMDRINTTSMEIQNIISAIEDIATQTNLLSLNASIEAARAGEAGRGFAVVADQIGKLATDSAQSAVDTRELIEKSIVEIESGNSITEQTVTVLEGILETMATFAESAKKTSATSEEQAKMLKEIEIGIEQIASVVESNSASAEETSATSEELSAQSENLKALVGQFKLRES